MNIKILKGKDMKHFFMATTVLLLLLTVGCEDTVIREDAVIRYDSYDTQRDFGYYRDEATRVIDEYRQSNSEFYGFTLGEEFEEKNLSSGTTNKKTGGLQYKCDDPKQVFDKIVINTDSQGIITKIYIAKTFSSPRDAIDFYTITTDKLKSAYQAMRRYGNGENAYFTEISVAENDQDWLDRYSNYLRLKDERSYVSGINEFRYILHPTLSRIFCGLNTRFVSKGKVYIYVSLEYESKDFIKMVNIEKDRVKAGLGDL